MERRTPLYLPLDEPLGRPTVHRFGTDFGNGALDARVLQPCADEERALAPTIRVADGQGDADVHAAALAWLDALRVRELGVDARESDDDDGAPVADRYARRLRDVAEDLVVVHRGAGEGSVRAVHVRAPSGWRPEQTIGASLAALHAHVPGLLARASAARLTSMMIDRGPYVRFVWGLTTSPALDHHPDRVRRPAWEDATEAFLRVERQLTIPLARVDAALFVLRVYVHPLRTLPAHARATLRRVLDTTTPELRAYKGFPADAGVLDRLVGR